MSPSPRGYRPEWLRGDVITRVAAKVPMKVSESSYEIRIRGRVTRSLLDSFERMESELEPVETVLHGPVRDQAELHGLIDRIQALGLELIEVRRLPG